jgi:hypothetical protein
MDVGASLHVAGATFASETFRQLSIVVRASTLPSFGAYDVQLFTDSLVI